MDQELAPGFPSAETFADKPFEIDRGAYRGAARLQGRLAFSRLLGQMRDLRIGAVRVPGNPRLQLGPSSRRWT